MINVEIFCTESMSLCSEQFVKNDLYFLDVINNPAATHLICLPPIWCRIKHVSSANIVTALILCIKMTNFLFAKSTTAIHLFSRQVF